MRHKLTFFLFYGFIAIFLIYNSFNYLDPDLGWHLKVGQDIFADKSAPGPELYNFPLEGKTWVDHEWLLDAGSFILFERFGYFGLTAFFALIVLLSLILLHWLILRFCRNGTIKPNGAIIMCLLILGALAMAPHIGVRMQVFALLNLILLLHLILSFEQGKKSVLWLLPGLFLFWANAHASFLIGLFILFTYLFWHAFHISFFNYLSRRFGRLMAVPMEKRQLLIFSGFSALAALATLINPYSWRLYSFLAGYANTFYLSQIIEWLPAYTHPIQSYQLFYLSLAAVMFIILIIESKGPENADALGRQPGKKPFDPWRLIIIFIFFGLAIKSRRHFPLFYIVSLPFLALGLSGLAAHAPKKIRALFRDNPALKIFLIAGLLLAGTGLILKTNFTSQPFADRKYCQNFPCQTLAFLKSDPENLRRPIFNDYGWGGYLVWTWPEKKIFIDGRLPQYPFAGHTFMEEYYEFFKENQAPDKLKEYGIELVLLKLYPPRQNGWFKRTFFPALSAREKPLSNHLLDYLREDNSWQLVYNDDISEVYVKSK